jgi:uridylate kinase
MKSSDMKSVSILSIGGSIVAPDKPDTAFLKKLRTLLIECSEATNTRYIIIIGGGGPCRVYQQACREISP